MQPENTSNNAVMKVFIPFLKATISVLQDITQEVFTKKNIYPFVGNISLGDIKVEIGVVGDIQTRVIFDFPETFARQLAGIMMGIAEEEAVDNETVFAAVQELGNMISGNAVGYLEELNIHCDITPPIIHSSNKQIMDDTAQLGVIEFNGEIGDFNIYVVINESKNFEQTTNIFSTGFEDEENIILSRFFFPKGIGIVGVTPINLIKKSSLYPPSLLLIKADEHVNNTFSAMQSLQNPNEISAALFGSSTQKPSIPLKNILNYKEVEDPYTFLEDVKKIASEVGIQVFAKRKEFIVDIPKNMETQAYFCVTPKSGEREEIPIARIGLESLVLDISNHQDINFPEGKNLANIELKLDKNLVVTKTQIGKMFNEEETLVEIKLRHILETEVSKITEFIYQIVSYY